MRDELEAAERAAAEKAAAAMDLYCPACKKKFKSQKQWENHERSERHRAAAMKVRSILHWSPYELVGDVNADP
jgi:DnaJ family protein A protein 5